MEWSSHVRCNGSTWPLTVFSWGDVCMFMRFQGVGGTGGETKHSKQASGIPSPDMGVGGVGSDRCLDKCGLHMIIATRGVFKLLVAT